MLTRLRAFAAAVTIVVGVMFATAAPVAAASYGTCSDPFDTYYFTGRDFFESQQYYGINASIDPDAGFHHCNVSPPTDLSGSSSVWVAFEGSGNQNQIIQIGLIHCTAATGYCSQYADQYRFFWAYGGCNGATPLPIDLGPGDLNMHTYSIENTRGDNYYRFYRDGSFQASIYAYDASVSCWLPPAGSWGTSKVAWMGERHDASDGLGSSVVPDTYFSGMAIHYGGSWHNISISGCNYAQGGHGHSSFCSASGNTMSVWTVY